MVLMFNALNFKIYSKNGILTRGVIELGPTDVREREIETERERFINSYFGKVT